MSFYWLNINVLIREKPILYNLRQYFIIYNITIFSMTKSIHKTLKMNEKCKFIAYKIFCYLLTVWPRSVCEKMLV